jgi:hypothetical protein
MSCCSLPSARRGSEPQTFTTSFLPRPTTRTATGYRVVGALTPHVLEVVVDVGAGEIDDLPAAVVGRRREVAGVGL